MKLLRGFAIDLALSGVAGALGWHPVYDYLSENQWDRTQGSLARVKITLGAVSWRSADAQKTHPGSGLVEPVYALGRGYLQSSLACSMPNPFRVANRTTFLHFPVFSR